MFLAREAGMAVNGSYFESLVGLLCFSVSPWRLPSAASAFAFG
jgi:hypothetical protein